MTSKISLIIADDEILIRKGLINILEEDGNFEIVAECNNGQELIQLLSKLPKLPDIILMDINMPVLNGIDATKAIIEKYPNIKIVALSSYKSDVIVSKILDIGAVAYLHKTFDPSLIVDTLKNVIRKGFHFEKDFLKQLEPILDKTNTILTENFLTKREIEILHYICREYTSAEIAEKLFLSVRTVEGHRNNIITKTGSRNIAGLVVFAIQHKFYRIDEDLNF